MRIRPARSIWVPPTSTVLPWPILSSIAAASHGVAMSRLIGPAPSRHHSAPKQPTKMTAQSAGPPRAGSASDRHPASGASTRRRHQSEGGPNGNATTAGAPGGPPPLPDPDPSRRRPNPASGVDRREHDPDCHPGRRIPCHCLSIQAPIVGLSTAGTAAVRGKRSPLRRHCRHTSNIPAVRHFAPGARSTSSGVVRGIPCNHTPAPPDLPSRGRDSGTPDETCNTALVDPPKASKGRRCPSNPERNRPKRPPALQHQKSRLRPSGQQLKQNSRKHSGHR